jgi:two-component system response regulator FlrC
MLERSILVVEDDPVQMRQMVRLLESEGHRLSQACSGREAINILEGRQFDLVLSDRKMPDVNGDSLLAHIRLNYPGLPIAIITAYPEGVEDLEPDAMLEKPFRGQQLRELVKCLLARRDD